MSLIERIASSLPGMTKSITSGSQLVSVMAMIGMPSLFASCTAIVSFAGSMTKTAPRERRPCSSGRRGTSRSARAPSRGATLPSSGADRYVPSSFIRSSWRMRSRPCLDGAEVRERAAEPAVDDEVAAPSGAPPRWTISCAWRLVPTMRMWPPRRDGVDDEVVRAREEARRLVEVDDVDAVARAVDERAHLRVPALGLVAEVDAGVEERLEREGEVAAKLREALGGDGLGHGALPFGWASAPLLDQRRPSARGERRTGSWVCAGGRVDWAGALVSCVFPREESRGARKVQRGGLRVKRKSVLGSAGMRQIVLILAGVALASACGGAKVRPAGPPPEYEEPAAPPSTPTVAPTAIGAPTPTVAPTSTPTPR